MKRDAGHIKDYLERVSGKSVSITVTDNATSMLAVKKAPTRIVNLRINHIFLDAQTEVIDEIAGFLTNAGTDTPLIREYIRLNSSRLKKPCVKESSIMTKGRYYDLKEIYAFINETYFSGTIESNITWGKANVKRRVRTRRFGSYNADANLIRISTVLDRVFVPAYVVKYIVFHEMLHARLGFSEANGRRRLHSSEFRKIEMLYPDFRKANDFLKNKLM